MANGKVYSIDLKNRVVEAAKTGLRMTDLAASFGDVPRGTLYSWIKSAGVTGRTSTRNYNRKSTSSIPSPAPVQPPSPPPVYQKIVLPTDKAKVSKKNKIVLICSDDSTQILNILKGMIDG